MPSPHTLATIPSPQLETICITACKLHVNWRSRSPSPMHISHITPQGEYHSDVLNEPIRSTHLSPGGRWLIIVTQDMAVQVLDLKTSVARSAIRRELIMHGFWQIKAAAEETAAGARTVGEQETIFHSFDCKVVVMWKNDMTARMYLHAAMKYDRYVAHNLADCEHAGTYVCKGEAAHNVPFRSGTFGCSVKSLLRFLEIQNAKLQDNLKEGLCVRHCTH